MDCRDAQPNDDVVTNRVSTGQLLRGTVRVLTGLFVGLLAGFATTLAIVMVRVILEEVYLHGIGEVVGWLGLPILVGSLAGVWIAIRSPSREFWRMIGRVVAGMIGGVIVGALVGGLVSGEPSAPWSGGIIGAAAGAIFVMVLSAPTRTPVTALLVPVVLGSCSDPEAPSASRSAEAPDPAEVESVVFLLGDPGVARIDDFPVLARMREDVEKWSERVDGEGNVVMLTLGDIIYPDGLHPVGDPTRESDSLRIADQIAVVSGEQATAAGARGLFLPGNHDWGQEEDWEGAVRLVRLADFLEAWGGPAAGRVELTPEAGSGGPGVFDVGERLRIITLDTGWWLLGASRAEKDALLRGVARALEGAGPRRTVMAAHHPLESGGPHGTAVEFGRTLGLRMVLRKAGIMLQDLESRPYRDLLRGLEEIFLETGGPDLFVGGHEHSLQVFDPEQGNNPRSLVVGSASKLTSVRAVPGMAFGVGKPGYAKIFFLSDGRIHVRIDAVPPSYLRCDQGSDPSEVCMSEAMESFETVWSETIGRSSVNAGQP